MDAIRKRIERIEIGEAIVHGNLTMFPLFTTDECDLEYLVLDEGLATGRVQVTEVSKQGSVGELQCINECDRPVFLLDGEELVGAKQNRVLNL